MSELRELINQIKKLAGEHKNLEVLIIGLDDYEECIVGSLCAVCASEIISTFIEEHDLIHSDLSNVN